MFTLPGFQDPSSRHKTNSNVSWVPGPSSHHKQQQQSVLGSRTQAHTSDSGHVFTLLILVMCSHFWSCAHTSGHVFTLLVMCSHFWSCVHTLAMCSHFWSCVHTSGHVFTPLVMCSHFGRCVHIVPCHEWACKRKARCWCQMVAWLEPGANWHPGSLGAESVSLAICWCQVVPLWSHSRIWHHCIRKEASWRPGSLGAEKPPEISQRALGTDRVPGAEWQAARTPWVPNPYIAT